MDEFQIPINCNIISDRESFGYNYLLMKYVIKPHITSLFKNNSIHHCNCNNLLLQLQ
mgnify:CR=1 FL=1